ncbi:MAG: TlpA disulfide reductase family protein [Campylobacterota bacterium]|nr:TlpA disulfide reductase family protein [Campylobacterota bacterium]
MFKKTVFAIIFIVAIFSQGCSDENEIDSDVIEEANSMISSNEFVLTSTDNKQYVITKTQTGFILDNDKSKMIVLDIFATWCPPCRATAPSLSALQKKYKDDLVVIGITIEDGISNKKLEEFKTMNSANYVIVNSSTNRPLVNEIAAMLKLGNNFPIPLMAIYKDGQLVNHYLGAVEEEFIDSDIKMALKK